LSLSLSHSGDRACCAITLEGVDGLGADLERIASRPPGFAADYFTPAEIAQVDQAPLHLRDTWITAIWSAKEAALKATRLGLSVDTRSVECRLSGSLLGALAGWLPFAVQWDCDRLPRECRPVQGWWRQIDSFVLTLATCPMKMKTQIRAPRPGL
jgi:phosphopantetheinyl transferase